MPHRLLAACLSLVGSLWAVGQAAAQPAGPDWVTSWAASAQGPYPVGNPSAQPDLRFAFPSAEAGARDQTMRLMLRPSIWGEQARLRFSNVLGTRPVTFDGVFAGLQQSGAVVEPGSTPDPSLVGNRLAVSFHIAGESGPMTWHAKALTTSYLTPPGSGAKGDVTGVLDFPFSTASWFFLDAVDMAAAPGMAAVVAFGDSITDGTASTMNGDDRWPDVLLQRLQAAGAVDLAVVNAGIGGNQVVGPAEYTPQTPFPGGPSALSRLDRDVIGLSGVKTVIWLEGINDLSKAGNVAAGPVIDGMKQGVARMRAAMPGVRVIGATVTSALGSSNAAHGSAEQDAQRKLLNAFIRTGGLFDSVVDFDAATLDPATGGMRPEFVPESTTGGPGDKLHPNRAGYQAMAATIDLAPLLAR